MFAVLGLFVLVGLVAACSSFAGTSSPKVEPAPAGRPYTGGPRLAVDNQSIDFGPVAFNKGIRANFQVKNVGDRRLTIRKVDVEAVQGC